ncbi:hypothetical protein NL676_023805 [Syzygium grande]|nr:hypothetical protein NL676_023805 [Syzygium grande]
MTSMAARPPHARHGEVLLASMASPHPIAILTRRPCLAVEPQARLVHSRLIWRCRFGDVVDIDMEDSLDYGVEYEIVDDEEEHEEPGGLAFEPR